MAYPLFSLAAQYDELVSQARQHMESGRLKEALVAAKQAILIQPDNYKAHYYAAMANMSLDDLAAAESEVAKSMNAAPISAKDSISKLVEIIREKKKSVKPIADAIVYLACSGELVEKANDDVAKRKNVDAIYRVNITASNVAEWENNAWSPFKCKADSRPDHGYISWSQNVGCRIDVENFNFHFSEDNTDDNGLSILRSKSILINRVTGLLTQTDYFTFKGSGVDGWTRTNVNGTCSSTTEPQALPPKPVKF